MLGVFGFGYPVNRDSNLISLHRKITLLSCSLLSTNNCMSRSRKRKVGKGKEITARYKIAPYHIVHLRNNFERRNDEVLPGKQSVSRKFCWPKSRHINNTG